MELDGATSRVQLLRRSARGRRLAARSGRYLVLGATAVMAIVGVREILLPEEPAREAMSEAAADPAAEGYALELARAYLSFDASRPQARERAIVGLLPDDLGPDGGFVPRSGARRVLWAEVVESGAVDDGGRTIVVAAQTDVDPSPLYLSVQVDRTSSGALRLAGYPALVGPPPVSNAALPEQEEVDDPALAAVVRRVLANYLAGEAANLQADLLPGARVAVPSVRLELRSIVDLGWAEQVDAGPVASTVEAVDRRGALYTLGYELGIERRGGRPYVSFIETSPNDPKE